jgi:L-fuconolactonase
MIIVDSHCHASPIWYEPVETLLFQMDRAGVGKAILIQLLGQTDNSYQTECVRRFPARFASVVGVDSASTAAPETLKRLAAQGAKGVRLRPDASDALWCVAEESRLAVSCVGTASSFCSPGFAARLSAFPKLSVVLEHLGGTARPDFDGKDETRASLMALSRFGNVSLKMPGLGQIAKRSPNLSTVNPLEPGAADILLEAVRHFGANRLMWGSDFPPVASREGYVNALRWAQEALSSLSQNQKNEIFGGTAAHIFGI